MGRHSKRLVDRGDIRVLIQDLDRQRHRDRIRADIRRGILYGKGQFLPDRQHMADRPKRAVYQNAALGEFQFFEKIGGVPQLAGEHLTDSPSGIPLVYDDFHTFATF